MYPLRWPFGSGMSGTELFMMQAERYGQQIPNSLLKFCAYREYMVWCHPLCKHFPFGPCHGFNFYPTQSLLIRSFAGFNFKFGMTVHRAIDMPSATGIDGVPEQMNGHHHMPMQNYHTVNVSVPNNNEENGIRDVWSENLYEEFRVIRSLLHRYNHVAMDTEFPGVVARPIGEFRNSSEYQYQLLRVNVDMLNIIQIGLTFMDEHGNTPPGISTWQFNFKFNLAEEMYAQDSIELLTNSGIQFKKHETNGIDWHEFSEFFITSGYLLNDSIKWLSFHSGYDFGYLLKILINKKLPKDESGFFDLLKIYFPYIYDVKYLMKSCKNLKGGLQEVADQLEIERIGHQHQAGSDSLLTGMAFFRMKEMFFEDNIDEAKYSGHLYGFGTSFAQSNDLTVYYVQPQ